MGQRANFVIVEPPQFHLYYSHWCANTLPRDMFWGPAHAEAFIRRQRQVGDDGWLDTVWAEGGAVLDIQNRTLLLFGGEDLLYDVPLRRLYLKLLGKVWQDWKVRWAHEGIVDIAEYVGVPRQKVISASASDGCPVASLEPPQERDWICCVGSFRIDDRLKLYPLPAYAEDYLRRGPSLCEDSDRHESLSTLALEEWTSSFPTGGFHVDSSRRTVDFWVSNDCPGVLDDVRSRWRGWAVTWHKDDYESQRALTGDSLKFNELSQQELAKKLSTLLMVETKAVDVLEIAGLLAGPENSKVEINPYALRDDRLPLGDQERRTILANAFSHIDGFELD
jgi:hypothetical protein